ncbi:MAG: hypothetical protein ACD_56C00097G0009 [uncultured bacterium]|nr:MAG: hypothetical protein ACD_56C00097G0009 [uncultured bacterium]
MNIFDNQIFSVAGALLLIINLSAFVVMYLDKSRARESGAERIPEGLMFFSAAAFGGVGVLGGMIVFRHKTAKWYFYFGIPLLILQNMATLFLAYGFLFN